MQGNGGGARKAIERHARPECPSCGANDWVIQDGAESGSLLIQVGGVTGGTDVLIYVCGTCGFLRMHSVKVLGGEI